MGTGIRMRSITWCLTCALICCAPTLVGCSGTPDAHTSEPALPPAKELIAEDVQQVVGTTAVLDAASLAQALRENETYAYYESCGLDIDAYAQRYVDTCSVELKSVEVNGDTAVATMRVTTLSLGDSISAVLDELIPASDVANMTDEDGMRLVMGALNDLLASPDVPTATGEILIDYVWQDGAWTMRDVEETQSLLLELMNTLGVL